MKKILLSSLIFLSAACLFSQAEDGYSRLNETAKQHLINLINTDTSQPDGNETSSARYIYKALNDYNIDWDIFRPQPERASLMAVIKGTNPKEKPLILLSHLDTVAPTAAWTYPPFKATLENGHIYGLGSTDDKNFTAVYLTIITWLKQNNIQPKRDIILLATADEEAGGFKGLKWLLSSNALSLPKGAFAINEGGAVIREQDKAPVFFIEAATKMYMDLKITARGSGGHAATADKDNNAVYNLTQALSKIEQLKMEPTLTPFTRKFFNDIRPLQDEDAGTTIDLLLGKNAQDSAAAAEIISQDTFLRSQLQDTLIPTVISSGSESNVSSSEASAIINARLLPSTDPDAFIEKIKNLFEDDDNITVEVVERPKTPFPQPSGGEDDLFKSIQKSVEATEPGARAILGMTPASSDSEVLRRNNITVYGLGITAGGDSEPAAGENHAHAADENLKEEDLNAQVKFFLNIIYNFAVGDDKLDERLAASAPAAK